MARIVLAMSGGIDSSVAAALLKRQGHNVIGVFMKFWKEGKLLENRCCSSDSEKRARKVAKMLNIPFYVLNFEKEFKKEVVDYFIKEIKLGRTPNPCVVCNKKIKLGLLFKKFPKDIIATGHYAISKKGRIFKAKDKEKDQSYFLWKLSKKEAERIIFPLGNYTKKQVKILAKKFKLPVLDLLESQEICFIESKTEDFLKRNIKEKEGKILDKENKVIGKHQGSFLYTIGQRKGINLSCGPYFVLNKKNNDIVVTKDKRDLFSKELSFKDKNWILKPYSKVKAKVRYKSKDSKAIIKNSKIIFSKPQRAITPGQSVVFYKGKELLGGGVIG